MEDLPGQLERNVVTSQPVSLNVDANGKARHGSRLLEQLDQCKKIVVQQQLELSEACCGYEGAATDLTQTLLYP